MIVDGVELTESNEAGKLMGRIHLSAGVHAIKLKSLGEPIELEKLTITRD